MNVRKTWYIITHWETWHYRVKYIPLAPFWLWYCLRAGSFWFFTPSNPTLTFGGFEGEQKSEMYEQLPPGSYPKTIYISPTLSFEEAVSLVTDNHFVFPFAVKPDAGMMGLMFRVINNENQFRNYHKKITVDYLVQELVNDPIEVSVFYYRFPHEQQGTITGFIRKETLEVVGDGKRTLEQLILLHPRARFFIEEMRTKHADQINSVIPEVETFRLTYAANLSRGGKLVSLEKEKDDRLLKIFDDLSHYAKHFYYGRYDIKCHSLEDLKTGRFAILEYNGSGAEPHHVYGNSNTLLQACKILLHHWDILYRISVWQHKNGIPYWKFKEGLDFLKTARKHLELLRKLDKETDV